jgi:aerobic-type carbon monoxide dehydrogenase small subunit (CoxS/CutS family)
MQVQELQVNGATVALDVDAATPLLSVLRDTLGLTGSKIGCGEGACGACTVLAGGVAIRACVTPVGDVAGLAIRTIEGLAAAGALHPLQQAFLDQQAFQCGYCTPGMIMAAVALLAQCPRPTEADIVAAMQGNICRCGTYPRIIRAIQQAAGIPPAAPEDTL